MPTYTFIDSETDVIEDIFMKMAELDEYMIKYPTKSRYYTSTPDIVSGVAHGKNKPDDAFRDILRQIKKNNYGSKINIP